MYECPNCGGNLKFDIPSQMLACSFCGTKQNPYEAEKEADAVEKEYFETTVFTCPQCAGELFSTDNEATTFCSFCGASTVLSGRIRKEKRPKYIIPFKKTKEDCKKAYAGKMKYAFFAPKELKDEKYIDGFRGIYMPYWSYQMVQNNHIRLHGEKSHRKGDYIITDHYNLEGDLNAYYLGFSKDAASNFYDSISEALAPFDAKELVNFTPSILSGFYADTADVKEEVYLNEMRELATDSSFEKITKREEFSGYHVDSIVNKIDLADKLGTTCREADSTMYPVWFLSYRKKDRIAYATVNGQTGKVVADMPIDIKKYLLTSLLFAVVIFLFLNVFFTIKPTTLMAISGVLILLSALLYSFELKAIFEKETNAGDKGLGIHTEINGEETSGKKISLGKVKKKSGGIGAVIYVIIMLSMCMSVFGTSGILIWIGILIGSIIIGVMGIRNSQKVEGMSIAPGFIISIVVTAVALIIRILNPVSDLYYYGVVLCSLLAVLYNLFDLIRNYNRLAMRRLPQFDKRGGDDRA